MRHLDPHPVSGQIKLTGVMGALSDPIRVALVRLLAEGAEPSFGELRVPVAKSTLSYHLKTLRAAGVIRVREQGTRCFIGLRRDDLEARFPGLLDAVLNAAENEPLEAEVYLTSTPR